jgi:hypothetical protein
MTELCTLAVGEAGIKTVDYVSGQNTQWLLTAVAFICGGLALFCMRWMLVNAGEVKKELKAMDAKYEVLNDKHMDVLQVSAATAAENAVRVTEFAKAVMAALDLSTGVVRSNTVAMDENTKATNQQTKSGEATTEALKDLKVLGEKTVSKVERSVENTDDFIRRNTRALEDRDRKRDGS